MKIKTKLYTCTININMNPRKASSQLPVGFQNKLYTLINIQDNRNSRYPPKQFKLRNQSINLSWYQLTETKVTHPRSLSATFKIDRGMKLNKLLMSSKQSFLRYKKILMKSMLHFQASVDSQQKYNPLWWHYQWPWQDRVRAETRIKCVKLRDLSHSKYF